MDEEAARALDGMTGTLTSGKPLGRMHTDPAARNCMNDFGGNEYMHTGFGDSGGASRFLYVAKASRAERDTGLEELPETDVQKLNPSGMAKTRAEQGNGRGHNSHATVKPVTLMRHLVRLVTVPGQLVLDPFAGSGTTGIACRLEGREFVGIERDPDYADIARRRIDAWRRYAVLDNAGGESCPETLDLFGEGS
jgi:site-specific DNA-methyltransferase (adenine-specific)